MKIIADEKMEDCLDGDFMFKYTLDKEWTKEAVKSLAALGDLKYYASFPIPMFQLSCQGGIIVKGVQGTDECRVIFGRSGNQDFKDESKGRFKERFEDILSSF